MKLLSFPVVLLRILGGFPFRRVLAGSMERTWVRQADHKNAGPRKFLLYRRSRLWTLWTSVVCVAMLAYHITLFATYYILREEEFKVITRGIAGIVQDLIHMVSITFVLTYFMLKKSSAQELISELQAIRRHGKATQDARRRNLLNTTIFMLYLACSVLVVGLNIFQLLSSPLFAVYFSIFATGVSLFIYGFTMSFYFVAISGLSEAYDETEVKLSQMLPPQSVNGTLQVVSKGMVSISMSTVTAEEIVRAASKTLLRLHHLFLLLHRYIAFPITMVMQMCVSATILNFFYFTFWITYTPEFQLLLVAYMITTMLPILVLCNVPQILDNRVRHLQSLTRSLLRSHFSHRLDMLLRDLLEILQEFPDFKMCGLFTLDRARLVEICSFMATYLIILLQFRLSEGFEKT